ncbi:ABC transporter permease [Microvirga pudoricolor]|uniref:ABC transporter permease n=1 Tax=Microvirga pudoricolor TaxID=2778729 RepID=UPI0019518C02|nr:ABC transporter permease [Microvirga pudoricolor]MBM6595225.1 ABC transporter permease [Microvirga pudoricolor]
MLYYILRRILYAVPIALGVSIVCFSLVYLAPGDPLQTLLPDDTPPEAVAELKAKYGFDRPVPMQYLFWLGNVLTGDFGTSIGTGRPVIEEIGRALSNTLLLGACAVAVAFTLAIIIGGVGGYLHGKVSDKVVTSIAIFGVSVPNYWLGIILVIVFAVELNLLPAVGMGKSGSQGFGLDLESLKYLILPTITLALVPLGIIARTVRASVAEVLGHEFVQTLRAKGLSERGVLRHVVKNAAAPVLAVMGLQFGHLIGGSIVVETVFSWPGTGFLLNNAILRRDVPILQGTILVLALMFVLTNLLVDLLQTTLDPRIRRA